MSQALIDAATAQATTTADADSAATTDASEGVWDQFDARPEDLHWVEDDDGVLYAGDAPSRPSTVVSVRLANGGLTVENVEASDLNFRRMQTVHRPQSDRDTSPQFD